MKSLITGLQVIAAIILLVITVGSFWYIGRHWAENTDIIVIGVKIGLLLLGSLTGSLGAKILSRMSLDKKKRRRK